jgi:hypothetical protein
METGPISTSPARPIVVESKVALLIGNAVKVMPNLPKNRFLTLALRRTTRAWRALECVRRAVQSCLPI